MRNLIVSSMIVMGSLAAGALAQNAAQDPSPAQPAVTGQMTDLRVEKLAPTTLMYQSEKMLIGDVRTRGETILHQLYTALRDAKIAPSGAPMLIFENATGNPTRPVEVQFCIPVPPDTTPVDEYQTRTLDTPRAATAVYVGKMDAFGPAVGRFYQSMIQSGYHPSVPELRVRSLYWEPQDVGNNVSMIEVPIQ